MRSAFTRAVAILLLFSSIALSFVTTSPVEKLKYAICLSESTNKLESWKEVAKALEEKHRDKFIVKVFTYGKQVEELREKLADFAPRYVCFVMPPEELASQRDFVQRVNRLLRQLDDDPYGDAVWGIITGYDVEDALRIAKFPGPIRLRRALSGCGAMYLEHFCQGKGFDEGKQGVGYIKNVDGTIKECQVPADATKEIVEELNSNKYDFFLTSGHATEHDWQIGYTFKSGQFRHENGQLFGLDTSGNRYDINSSNPKVYLPAGNCLIAHIDGKDCMATSFMHSCGVYQMFGYTVPTWYGFGGWNVMWFTAGAGDYHTFAEATFFTNQTLLMHLVEKVPEVVEDERHNRGHLYDRDVCVLYGDPALEVRMNKMCNPPAVRQRLEVRPIGANVYKFVFSVTALKDISFDPTKADAVATFFPFRIKDVKELKYDENTKPVITDDFLLLQIKGSLKKGEMKGVEFIATRI
ncbi:hypothetical protein H5T87_08455 [bacterium]|nr:hypothetical protein [bacterium]